MKNPATYLRRRVFALLHNQISYDGGIVPVYEGQGPLSKYMVIIGPYSDTDASNKHKFVARATLELEIIVEKTDASSRQSDEIAELVAQLIHPTTRSEFLTIPEFQVFVQGQPSLLPLTEDGADGAKIIRRIMRYNLLIAER